MSQGILQSIFEYQTQIYRLTGMDASNASLYDAGSALGEALRIAWEQTKRHGVCLHGEIHPGYCNVAKAYRKPGTHLDEREIGPDTAAVSPTIWAGLWMRGPSSSKRTRRAHWPS